MGINNSYHSRSKRLTRTISLATVATLAAIFWLGKEFGIDSEELLEFLLMAFLFVLSIVAVGGLSIFVLAGIRKIFRGY